MGPSCTPAAIVSLVNPDVTADLDALDAKLTTIEKVVDLEELVNLRDERG